MLSEYRADERRQQIGLRAAQLSVNVTAVTAVTAVAGGIAELAAAWVTYPVE